MRESFTGRNLALHIGLTKTASTFLQEEIFSKHPEIVYLGKRVPPTPNRQWCKPLLRALRSKDGPQRYQALFEDLSLRIKGDQEVLLASSEDFIPQPRNKFARWGIADYELFIHNLGELRRAWEQAGGSKLRIVVVIRRQDTWLASHYLQAVNKLKNFAMVEPSQRHFTQCVRHLINSEFHDAPFLFYDQLLEDLAGMVDEENLHVAVFEDLREDAHGYFGKMFDFLEVESFDYELREVRPSKTEDDLAWSNEFLSIRLSERQSRRILRKFRRSNRRTSNLIGADLKKHGYIPPIRRKRRLDGDSND